MEPRDMTNIGERYKKCKEICCVLAAQHPCIFLLVFTSSKMNVVLRVLECYESLLDLILLRKSVKASLGTLKLNYEI